LRLNLSGIQLTVPVELPTLTFSEISATILRGGWGRSSVGRASRSQGVSVFFSLIFPVMDTLGQKAIPS